MHSDRPAVIPVNVGIQDSDARRTTNLNRKSSSSSRERFLSSCCPPLPVFLGEMHLGEFAESSHCRKVVDAGGLDLVVETAKEVTFVPEHASGIPFLQSLVVGDVFEPGASVMVLGLCKF